MLRGYRGIFVAIIGGLVLFAIGAGAERAAIWTDSPHGYPKYRETAQEAQQRLPTLSLQEALKAAKEKQPCRNPEGHDASDLCAQWRAADAAERASRWAWWQLILSFFGVLGLATTLWFNLEAWRQAREANRLAELSNRPMIVFHSQVREKGERAVFAIKFQNAGQRIAHIESEWWSSGLFADAPYPSDNRPAREPREYSVGAVVRVAEVWPPEAYAYRPIDVTAVRQENDEQALYVFGEIVYSDGFGPKRKTTFCRRFSNGHFVLGGVPVDKRLNDMT